jgi:succinate dehydrogenase / fumarate reductase membrane anchor subunit
VSFVVMRTTAVLLAVLVLGHFAVTHVANDVAATGAGFALRRWSSALWLAWDATMLAAALIHAGCGIWLVIGERASTPKQRKVLHLGLVVTTTAVFAVGVTAIAVAATKGSV